MVKRIMFLVKTRTTFRLEDSKKRFYLKTVRFVLYPSNQGIVIYINLVTVLYSNIRFINDESSNTYVI